ncbi:MAG: aminopeptidase P family protein [Solirubrobacterales bacterium]
MPDHPARLANLRAALADRELDQLLVTNLVNARYLAGFTGTNGALVVTAGEAVLFTDFRYMAQAAEQAPGFEIVDGGHAARQALAERILEIGGRAGFDDADMRVQAHAALVGAIADGVEMVPAAGLVERLRSIKDSAEIASISAAARLADSIYDALAERGLAGRRERDVAWQIELLAHELGAEGLSFPPIVAAGPHGALPHAHPRDAPIPPGELVVLDLGVIVDGYCSDATRTFASGNVSDHAREIFDIVATAQRAALDAIAPGIECKAVDAAARDVIDGAGYGGRFGHSTGHGVGLEVHERPTLAARSEDSLEPGHVVTVEPGVYIPGELGVRIEDLIVVEAGGPRILSLASKDLLVVD